MKKNNIIALVLAVLTLFSCVLPVYAAQTKKGDIDGDYEVTVNDARKCLRAAIGLETLKEEQIKNADIDLDDSVTVSDARIILRLAIGLSYSGETDNTDPEKEKPEKSLEQQNFENVLYTYSHQFVGTAKSYVTSDFTGIAKNFQKWCAQYTMGDILRPVLQKLGYSEEAMNKLAPARYSQELWYKLMRNNNVPYLSSLSGSAIAATISDIYTPSLLMGYYQSHEADGICRVYNFVDYYDNEISGEIKKADPKDVAEYTPEVGDILFITNKNKMITGSDTDVHNYIIHTAQIIQVYEDGTYLTTEGAIIEPAEGDGVARVRERVYFWADNQKTNYDAYGKKIDSVAEKTFSTYIFSKNSTVVVLAAVRPDWFGIK